MRGIRIHRHAIVLVFGLGLAFSASGATTRTQETNNSSHILSPLWFYLEPGPFRIGFQLLYRIDSTRPYDMKSSESSDSSGRPMRIMILYPAEHSSDQHQQAVPMRFGDYVALESSDPRFAQFNRMMRERDEVTTYRQFTGLHLRDLATQLMNTTVPAYLDAPPAKGRFPIVMHSTARNNSQQESTVLWEYLASHGYVVASVSQLGFKPESRFLNFALSDIQLQQKDIEFALREVSDFANADAGRIVTMGHSSGGVVSLLVAANNRNVDAVVSLDGELTGKAGIAIIESAELKREQFHAHILAMYRANDNDARDFSLLNSLSRVDRYYLRFLKATHFDFQNWPLYSVLMNRDDERGTGIRSANTGRDNYFLVILSVREFLDGVVKRNVSALPWFHSIASDHIWGPRKLINFRFQKGAKKRTSAQLVR